MLMDHAEAAEQELRQRIARHPPDRFPIQHATACFHLGTVLTDSGHFEEAQEVLRRADGLFEPHLPVERAKTQVALGAAQRAAGRGSDAADNFRRAAVVFDRHEQWLEAGAAWFNLGLVERERGAADAAVEAFSAARERLEPAQAPAAAASLAREFGSLLLERGDVDAARQQAELSQELSQRIGDHAAVGHAANVLGLAELADGNAAAAVEAFRTATAAHPRTVRPEAHAMAAANLALAHERRGEQFRARFAARRALAVAGAADAVHAQAGQIIERLGDPPGDLARVLEEEPAERGPELVRVEFGRWAECDADARTREADAWISAQTTARDPVGHAVLLVGGLLELPPEQLQRVVDGLLDAWVTRNEGERESFRAQLSRAVVRFHMPQWLRLQSEIGRAHV